MAGQTASDDDAERDIFYFPASTTKQHVENDTDALFVMCNTYWISEG